MPGHLLRCLSEEESDCSNMLNLTFVPYIAHGKFCVLYFTYCGLCAVSGFKFCYLYNLKIHKKNKLYSSSNTYLFPDSHMLHLVNM